MAALPSSVFHIADWGFYPELKVGSDHRVIMVPIDQGVERVVNRMGRNWKKTNWHEFNRDLF